MRRLKKALWEAVKVAAAALVAAIAIEICHEVGWFPERKIVDVVMSAPGAFSVNVAYAIILAVIALLLLFAEHWLGPVFARKLGFAKTLKLEARAVSSADPYDKTVRWAVEQIAADPHEMDAALREMRQAARSGVITIYGRPESNSLASDQFYKPIEAIPADHWRDFDFDVMRCIFHEDTRECRSAPDDRRSARYQETYVDLRVNSAQIKAKWSTPLKAAL